MGWFNPAPHLSDRAKEVFEELVSLSSSEASGVGECLNTIAENDEEQAQDEYLRNCACEMRDYCQRVIDALTPPVVGPFVRAECHSDDRVVEVEFDAARWLHQASEKEIIDLALCDWGGDYPADAVAEYEAEFDEGVANMYKYLELRAGLKDSPGFECHVDEDQAKAWLAAHRPEILAKLPPEDE